VVVGRSIGPSLAPLLAEEDRRRLEEAVKDFYKAYKENIAQLEAIP